MKAMLGVAVVLGGLAFHTNGFGQSLNNDDELGDIFAIEPEKSPPNRWFDSAPFVSFGLGVGESAEMFTASPWATWGPVIGTRGGVLLPLGLRLEAAMTWMPYSWATRSNSTKEHATAFAAKVRVGWGLWLDSVWVGAKIGYGLPTDRVDWSVVADWHISGANFYHCEIGLWSNRLAGQICGYGWRF